MGRDTDNEMRQIQRGLETFLQQELQEIKAEETQRKQEPQLYVIGNEETEKELDIIGNTSGRKKTPVKKRARENDYTEDWDRPDSKGQNRRQPQDTARHRTPQDPKAASGRRAPQNSKAASGRRAPQNSKAASGRRSPQNPKAASGHRSTQDSKAASGRRSSQRQEKTSRRRSPLKKFLVIVALLVVLAGGGLYFLVGSAYDRINYESIDSVADQPMQEDGVVNILLIGNDSRQNGEDGRSDAMILLSVSNRTKTIYMTSLLRDMYVDIPGHDSNRLNAAYSFGGAELLMETVEENLDISVNRYMLVNFEAFANLVDAVGGVDLELTTGELEYVNGYLVEYNMLTGRPQGTDNMDTTKPGLVHLNGPQALAYCRNRYIGTDFGRTERQRKVLTAVIKKLPTAIGTNFQELMDGLMPNMTTNLTRNECYRLSLMAGKLLTYDIVSDSIPQPNTYENVTIRKMSVLKVDFEANIKYLKEKIYGETGE